MYCLSQKTRGNWTLSVHLEMGNSWLKSGIWHNSFPKYLTTFTHQPSHRSFSGMSVGLCHLTFAITLQPSGWGSVLPPERESPLKAVAENSWEDSECHAKAEGLPRADSEPHHDQTARMPRANYSHYRTRTAASLWPRKMAAITPVAIPLTRVRNKQAKRQMHVNF